MPMAGVDIALEVRDRAGATLRVSGRLRPGWCGNLAAGLAGEGVAIVRGRAVTSGAGTWEAIFELCHPSDKPLGAGEIEHFLETPALTGFAARLDLTRYRLESSSLHGGSLRLDLDAPDRVGFLAVLLRRLAYYALFPVELRLDSVDGAARDRIWLRGEAGSLPRPGARIALAAGLDALVGSHHPLGDSRRGQS